jgi:hypothetical protein
MLAKIEFNEIDSWNLVGAHPTCMLLLYKGLVLPFLDYAPVCYSGNALFEARKTAISGLKDSFEFNAVDAYQ